MLIHHPTMTNTERQRRFRLRNPGYFKRYNRKYTAAQMEAWNANLMAETAEPVREPEPPALWLASA